MREVGAFYIQDTVGKYSLPDAGTAYGTIEKKHAEKDAGHLLPLYLPDIPPQRRRNSMSASGTMYR